ncbi:MAG: hypothetical protein ACI4BC_07225 [Muribaculaceae bacterium]
MKFKKYLKFALIFYVVAFVCYVIGLCLGGLLRGFTPIEIFVSKGSTIVVFFIVSTVMLIFSYPVVVVSAAFHEFGHFLFGWISGYKFVSFRVLDRVLIRKDGKFCIKRFNIPGTLGQCLMMPPERPIAEIPMGWYMLGGVVMNLLLLLASALILWKVSFPVYLDILLFCLLWMLVFVNAYLLIVNGIPMQLRGVVNDGKYVFSLLRDSEYKQSLVMILRINSALQNGIMPKDLPEEWFAHIDFASVKGHIAEGMAMNKFAVMFDRFLFADSLEWMEKIYAANEMTGIMKYEYECEIVFLSLILGKKERAEELWSNEELRKYCEALKPYTSGKIRVYWAVVKYLDGKDDEADEILAYLKQNSARFLLEGEVKSDIAIIEQLNGRN